LATDEQFYVKFWGVRGSIACPGPEYVRYGGNTSCLEVRCGEHLLIFDAGTGIRPLGLEMLRKGDTCADLFLTHTHFDHITGLPFFMPLFLKSNRIKLWAGHLAPTTIRSVLRGMMVAPLFPVPPEIFRAEIDYIDFQAGETLRPQPGVEIRTAPLNHPNGATGYRVDYAGKSICYVTDTEHVEGEPDQNILGLIDGADVMIYDSTYTDAEFEKYKEFGHSTWQEGARLCRQAKVGTFVIFHHDPMHEDDAMDEIAKQAEAMLPGTVVAREGMVITP
jgi:phosphoribosyl 1,2-cyclic phosphodiesterase